jgi:hypothetical protein
MRAREVACSSAKINKITMKISFYIFHVFTGIEESRWGEYFAVGERLRTFKCVNPGFP